jgi:hypothetical protein
MGCGGAGAPCCAGPNSESCLGTLICGSNGHCTAPPPPCGGPSQPCCSGGCSGTDLRCDAKTDTCMACGGLGQMCCSNGGCRDAFDGFRSVSTGCTSPTYSKDPIGTCQECGGPGQICCPSTAGDGELLGLGGVLACVSLCMWLCVTHTATQHELTRCFSPSLCPPLRCQASRLAPAATAPSAPPRLREMTLTSRVAHRAARRARHVVGRTGTNAAPVLQSGHSSAWAT